MTIRDKSEIEDILTRGVEEIFVKEHLAKTLLSGKKLRIKYGIDPTGPYIHLGRASTLLKVKAFQDAGHQIVLVVGDFTARIGDPSDKLKKRPMLSMEDVEKNMSEYIPMISKIIDIDRAEIRYNSEWLKGLAFDSIAELAESFSVQQMSSRRNFKERIERGEEVSVREFLYPLMQGYDSFAVRADVEIGGFDQLFNLQAGRVIQKHYGQPEQDIIAMQMLEGTDGRKMSTTWGNVINITDTPDNMFGKIMSLNDELIEKYFLLATEISKENIQKNITENENPRDQKIILAEEITKMYHGQDTAKKARENFISTFTKKEIPTEMMETHVASGELLSGVLMRENFVPSKNELRRLAGGGGIHNLTTGETIKDIDMRIESTLVLKIGKKKFIKILV